MTHKISIIPDYNTCSSPLTAMSSSAKVSLLSCQNPLCVKFNKKPFSTQTAYTQHIDRNIGCYSYVVMRSQVLSRHGAPVVPCHPSVHEDGNVIPPELIQFVCSSFKEMDKVVFCTEYKRDVHTFRCHPCYQSDGPIYDWVVINFGKELGNFPCRLALVVVVDSPHDLEDKYQLVVQSATEEVTEHASVLLREWKWSPEYHLVSASTIVGPCFVISVSHNSSTVLETKPYCEWASLFT